MLIESNHSNGLNRARAAVILHYSLDIWVVMWEWRGVGTEIREIRVITVQVEGFFLQHERLLQQVNQRDVAGESQRGKGDLWKDEHSEMMWR